MISVRFQGKPFNITVIQAYTPTSNAEEAGVEWFYEDLQDLPELTPKKDDLFIIGDWNAKVGSQETLGVTGKFGLGVQNEAGQRLIEFCQAHLSMRFSLQIYWSGLPFPPAWDLLDPDIEPTSLAALALADRFFTTEPPGKSVGRGKRNISCHHDADISPYWTFLTKKIF